MPFLLVFIGLIMIVTGARNTHEAFAKQLQSDFTGPNNFLTWIVAIGAIGALGYIDKLRSFSHYFMALVILSLLLSNGGFFAQFSKALATGPVAATAKGADGVAVGSNASASAVDPAAAAVAGAFGQKPSSSGQAKANGWFNYLLGGGWLK